MHMLYCRNPVLEARRVKAIDSFEAWLMNVNTDPAIIHTITEELRHGDSSKFSSYLSEDASELIREAAVLQDAFGRLQFHKGRIATLWDTAQKVYFQEHFGHTRKIQTKWSVKLIARINKFNMELWENRNAMVQEYKTITANAIEKQRLEAKIF